LSSSASASGGAASCVLFHGYWHSSMLTGVCCLAPPVHCHPVCLLGSCDQWHWAGHAWVGHLPAPHPIPAESCHWLPFSVWGLVSALVLLLPRPSIWPSPPPPWFNSSSSLLACLVTTYGGAAWSDWPMRSWTLSSRRGASASPPSRTHA
jgi:hypothetical protein